MKRNVWKSSSVICPHYRKESKNVIFCEGYNGSIGINLSFETAERKKQYKKDYCGNQYGLCPFCLLRKNGGESFKR